MSELGAARDPLAGFPDDVAEVLAPYMAPPAAFLDAIGLEIKKKRDEAKEARITSGIEQIWSDAEEAYIGIDEANRSQFTEGKWSKGLSPQDPVTTGREPGRNDNRSTIFIRLTARYTDAAAAKLSEILLAPDDRSFKISPTPVPDLIKAKGDNSHVFHDGLGGNPAPLFRPLKPGEQPPQPANGNAPAPNVMASALPQGMAAPAPASPVAPPPVAPAPVTATSPMAMAAGAGQPQPAPQGAAPPANPLQPPPGQAPLTVKDLADEALELAEEKAKRAEDRIYGWMVKSQYRAECRKAIFDGARLGTLVLKGPFPKPKRVMALVGAEGGHGEAELQIKEDINPSVKWVDPWNCFPDPACGENIHEGDYFLERDYLSDKGVRELEKTPGYIRSQIARVLDAGPPENEKTEGERAGNPTEKNRKGRYEVWYFYGALKLKDFRALCTAGYPAEDARKMLTGIPKDAKLVYAIVTLIGDTVVRAALNPLDTGSFPYHSMPWQRRAGHWAGVGVPEQIRAPQRIVNGATRGMMDNAGLTAGPQVVIDKGSIMPADNEWGLVPLKIWYRKADSTVNDNRQAFTIYDIPSATNDLKIIVDFGMQLAEESTSIPLITQGQSGQTTPETYGAAALQDTNANQLLRSIAECWDDNIGEPLIRQFYEWLLLDPNVPDEDKGDFEIDAHGSVALVERAIQDQTILQLGATVGNPIYGGDPKKWFKELLKSKRLQPSNFTYSEQDQQKLDSQPPAPAPQVQAAQINADTQLKLGIMKQQTAQQDVASEEKIEQAAQALEGQKTQVQATVDLHELQMKHQHAMLEYANRNQVSLNEVKANLAERAMTLQTQRELNAQDNALALHKHHVPGASTLEKMTDRPSGEQPPVRVPGKRADNGRAFEQTR